MRSGVHKETIQQSLEAADRVMCQSPVNDNWGLEALLKKFPQPTSLFDCIDKAIDDLRQILKPGDHVVVMSNSGFGGIHEKILAAISSVPTKHFFL
jgi:UDP-N-acetylmuramate: L-alanyl-gamma-D-glutamyl-meso-diaminopimelate ligase